MSVTQEPASALLSPFPEGWYFVADRRSLDKDRLIEKTWMGEKIVIWSDESGDVCVAEAYCPHLGADLGPPAGGRVRGGRLVCPFHGFEYDASGQCVATPYAPPPKYARLRVFETQELVGLIFAWWGIGGRAPQWDLPAEVPDQTGWSEVRIWTSRFAGHPQETTENAVDMAHLRHIHGYDGVKRVEPVSIDGHRLKSRFDFITTRRLAGIPLVTLDVAAEADVCGLGYSFVEVFERSIGMNMRLWVLATPVDGKLIDLSVVSQVREIRKPNRWLAGLGFLPPKQRAPVMNRLVLAYQRRDVLQDVVVWSHKRPVPNPRLARSDGEIMAYRRWCAQFYPETPVSVGDGQQSATHRQPTAIQPTTVQPTATNRQPTSIQPTPIQPTATN